MRAKCSFTVSFAMRCPVCKVMVAANTFHSCEVDTKAKRAKKAVKR